MRKGLLLIVALVLGGGCERASAVSQRAREARPAGGQVQIASSEAATPPTSAAGADSEGCGAELDHTVPADLYRALTLGAEEDRAVAALAILKDRSNHARAVVQRAIVEVGTHPYCAQLRPLVRTLEDATMDEPTRSSAALALGAIAHDFPCTFPRGACPKPHDPIPSWAQHALRSCATNKPVMLARACVEALGYVSSTDLQFLTGLRDDPSQDAVLRVFAGRALTRITHVPQVTPQSLDGLMTVARSVGAK